MRTSRLKRSSLPAVAPVLVGLVVAALVLPGTASAASATSQPSSSSSSPSSHPAGTLRAVHLRSFHSVSLRAGQPTRALLTGGALATWAPAPTSASLTTTPVSQFKITYKNDINADGARTPWTAVAENAFQAAVNLWSREIQSTQPLTIEAHSKDFGDPRILGDASPGDFVTAANPNVAYPLAYVDAQRTTPFEPGPDIIAEFNPARTDLYFGTDGRTPSAGVDFESVVLHEIGHGLGLVGAGYVNGTRGYDRLYDAAGSAGPMTVFDTFTYAASPTATKPITSYVNDSSALGTALEGFPNSSGVATGGVYWSGTAGRVGGGGAPVRLYAPGAFQDGSSYSHLDEGMYPRGNPNALMTPALSSGEAVHDPGPIALGMLSDMGWAVPGMPGSAFAPVSPVRLLDTRAGLGAPRARVGPGGTVDLKVAGTSTVPTNATAVVLNITGVKPTGGTDIRVYPTPGASFAPPGVSVQNLGIGGVRANLATVAVGSGGRVRLRNNAGSADLLADLAGYYAPVATAARYHPLAPTRFLDTRSGLNAPAAPVGPAGTLDVDLVTQAGIPSAATAVALTVTAASPSMGTSVAVYPTPAAGGTSHPGVSNINIGPGTSPIPNLVVVKVGDLHRVRLRNDAGTVDLLADVVGYYDTSTSGLLLRPVEPSRVLDTRNHTGTASSAPTALGAGQTLDVNLDGLGRIPELAGAAVLNATGVAATTSTDVRLYPTPIDGSAPQSPRYSTCPPVRSRRMPTS